MHENLKSGLVKEFMKSVKPNEICTSVEFQVQDQVMFQIKISSNTGELDQQVRDVIQVSIASAIKSLSSEK